MYTYHDQPLYEREYHNRHLHFTSTFSNESLGIFWELEKVED